MHDVWSLFFHLVGVTGFMLAHGSSAGMAFAMRRERDPERMRRLLQLSEASFNVMYPALLVLIAGGVVGAFRRHYWSFWWVWVAIGLLVVAFGIMFVLGGGRYSQVRKVLGIRYREGFKILPPEPKGTQQELEAAATRLQPFLLPGVGLVVILVSLYMMISKPF